MKKILFLITVVMVIALFSSCNQDIPINDITPVFVIDTLKEGIMAGNFNNNYIMVEISEKSDDTVFGNYLLQRKSSLVLKKKFVLHFNDANNLTLSCPDFEGDIEYQGIINSDSVNVVVFKRVKILGFIPWGKREYKINLSPYREEFTEFLAGRYVNDVFTDITVDVDVEYGKAKGYWVSFSGGDMNYWEIIARGSFDALRAKVLPLQMDIYLPQNDKLTNRPLLVLIHGGGFYVGDKAEPTYLALARYFVKKGYVVASINYRMGFHLSAKSVERAGYRGLQDARAALRFLSSRHEQYGFDPDNIFLAGSSAGSITALNVAFMDDDERPEAAAGGFISRDLGLLDESGNDVKASYTVRGVVNMWGAVDRPEIINDDEEVLLLHFHGDCDEIVPYECGMPFANIGGINDWLMPEMCGSKFIHEVAKQKHWHSELITFPEQGHMPHLDENMDFNDNFNTILLKTRDFIANQLIDKSICIDGDLRVSPRNEECRYSVKSLHGAEIYNWSVKGGFIKSFDGDSIEVLWYKDEKVHQVSCVVINDIGAQSVLSVNVELP